MWFQPLYIILILGTVRWDFGLISGAHRQVLAEISARHQQDIKDTLDCIHQQIDLFRGACANQTSRSKHIVPPEEPYYAHETNTNLCASFILGFL